MPFHDAELEDNLRAQLDDPRIEGVASPSGPTKVAGDEVPAHRTMERTCATRSGGELGVVPRVIELKTQFKRRLFVVEGRDVVQG